MKLFEDNFNLTSTTLKMLGTEFKRRRKNHSRTLDSMDCGCSISYLSKIENGKIKPKMEILQELCIEHGILQEELEIFLKIDENLKLCVKEWFDGKTTTLESIYNKFTNFDNYKVNLLMLFYEAKYMHWDILKDLIKSLSVIEKNMDQYDYEIFSYFKLLSYNHEKEYHKSYDVYMDVHNSLDPYLRALILKEYFISCSKCGLLDTTIIYNKLLDCYLRLCSNNYKELTKIYIVNKLLSGYEFSIEFINNFDKEELFLFYLLRNDQIKLKELLLKGHYSVLEKLIVYSITNEYDKAKNAYAKLKFQLMTGLEIMIANCFNYYNECDFSMLFEYIMKVLIPYLKETNNGALYKRALMYCLTLAKDIGKYKSITLEFIEFYEFSKRFKLCMH